MNHGARNVTGRNYGANANYAQVASHPLRFADDRASSQAAMSGAKMATQRMDFGQSVYNGRDFDSSQYRATNGAGRNRSVTSVIHEDRGASSVTGSSVTLVPNASNSSPSPRGTYAAPQTHFQDVSLWPVFYYERLKLNGCFRCTADTAVFDLSIHDCECKSERLVGDRSG